MLALAETCLCRQLISKITGQNFAIKVLLIEKIKTEKVVTS